MATTTETRDWTLTISYVDGQGWEASLADESGVYSLHYSAGDPDVLLAAVARDLKARPR